MADIRPPSEPRRYDDEEVRLILKRAAELQQQAPATDVDGSLSLSDLEDIATQAGIDPRHLRQAAVEVASGPPDPLSSLTKRLLGAPLNQELSRAVSGTVPESAHQRLLTIIRDFADAPGKAEESVQSLTWQSSNPGALRSLHVSVSSGRGETQILIKERQALLAGGLFGGIIGGAGGGIGFGFGVGFGVGLGVLGSALFTVLWPIVALGGSFLIARSIFSAASRRRKRLLDRLMERLVNELATDDAGKRKMTLD